MLTPDVIEYQFREVENRWIVNESRSDSISSIADDIYTKLLNGQVVYVDNQPYSIDNVIEEVCSQPTFATIVMTAFTLEQEAGHDLANTAREEAERLAKKLAEELYEQRFQEAV